MPQILALALVGGVVWYGYKMFKHEMKRVGEELDQAEKDRAMKEVTNLKEDKDGVYRPKDPQEL